MTILMGYFANDLITKKLEEYSLEEEQLGDGKSLKTEEMGEGDMEEMPLTGPSSLKTRND